jgi:hypothetical protein
MRALPPAAGRNRTGDITHYRFLLYQLGQIFFLVHEKKNFFQIRVELAPKLHVHLCCICTWAAHAHTLAGCQVVHPDCRLRDVHLSVSTLGSTHPQASFNTMGYEGRDSASEIGRKLSLIRPGSSAVVAPQSAGSMTTEGRMNPTSSKILGSKSIAADCDGRVPRIDPTS